MSATLTYCTDTPVTFELDAPLSVVGRMSLGGVIQPEKVAQLGALIDRCGCPEAFGVEVLDGRQEVDPERPHRFRLGDVLFVSIPVSSVNRWYVAIRRLKDDAGVVYRIRDLNSGRLLSERLPTAWRGRGAAAGREADRMRGRGRLQAGTKLRMTMFEALSRWLEARRQRKAAIAAAVRHFEAATGARALRSMSWVIGCEPRGAVVRVCAEGHVKPPRRTWYVVGQFGERAWR